MTANYKPQGYHKLALLMGCSSDLTIFRRFNDLNILSLMSLQAELVDLRDDFYSICADDEKSGQKFHQSFAGLFGSRNSPNNFQHEKLLAIREKMNEYNDRLLQVAAVYQLDKPSKANIEFFEEWLRDSKGGASLLQTDDFFAWDRDFHHDLLTFNKPPPDQDAFTKWLTTWPITVYHRLWGHKHNKFTGARVIDEETGMVDYHEGRFSKVTKLISVTVASTMPMIAILGLYFQKSLLLRIYTAIGITAAFAAILVIFTSARRIEIFMATAGLAAVEVVFIGSAERK